MHGLENGEYVSLIEVKGMAKINEGGPYKVTVKSPFTFTIDCDTREMGKYETGGYCT